MYWEPAASCLVACLKPCCPLLLSQESMCVRGWVVAFEGFRRGSALSRWQLLRGLLHVVNIALLEHKVIYFSIETKANHDQPI